MRRLSTDEHDNRGFVQNEVQKQIEREEESFRVNANHELKSGSVMQLFIVDWQMQTIDLKKFIEKPDCESQSGFYLH
jgi:hypothetical protein